MQNTAQQISSKQNSRIKNLRSLLKDKKTRAEFGVYVAEGVNLVKDIPPEVTVKELYIQESKYEKLAFLEEKFSTETYIVKDEIFESISETVTPSGVIAVIKKNVFEKTLTEDFVLLLDGIMDAGNMGTIIRTATARGIKTVISVDGTDPYSPKSVRAAMGGTFYTNVIECSAIEAIELLTDYKIVALDMNGTDIFGYKMNGKTALAVGSEAHGLSSILRDRADDIVAIPMKKGVESLNAAMSIGIAMFIIK